MEINSNLTKLRIEMLDTLTHSGYSKHTIRGFQTVFKKIEKAFQTEECRTYEDVFWKHYGNKTKALLREGRWRLGAIKYFDDTGCIPGGTHRSKIGVISKYDQLSSEFKVMADHYRESEAKRGIKASTINVCFHNAVCFFIALQDKGIQKPEQITAKPVRDYFCGDDGKPCKSGSLRKNLLSFFRACSTFLPGGMENQIIGVLPEIAWWRTTIQ